jgi:glutamine synthetase
MRATRATRCAPWSTASRPRPDPGLRDGAGVLPDRRQRQDHAGAASPRSGKRRKAAETLSIRALDAFDTFFTDLYDACEAMDIPADTTTSETGLGQFEVNLMHCDDALRAADDAWLFKMLVKGLARRHGFAASFMAKPYPEYSGSGLHTHFSVIDKKGDNVFDSGGPKGTAHAATRGRRLPAGR